MPVGYSKRQSYKSMKMLKIEFQSSKERSKPLRIASKEKLVKNRKLLKNRITGKTSMAQRRTGLQSVGKV